MIMGREDIQVPTSGNAAIEPDAAVAGNAAVHFMVDEGTEVLVTVRAFFEARVAVIVPGHDRHILEVAFAAFVADRAVVRMIFHQEFRGARTEGLCLGIIHGDAHAFGQRGHAGHDDSAARVFFVLELLHRALAACAHGVHGRVPAEIREVEAQGEAGLEEVLARLDLVVFVVDEDIDHNKTFDTDLRGSKS
jgi:hypothetical protein